MSEPPKAMESTKDKKLRRRGMTSRHDALVKRTSKGVGPRFVDDDIARGEEYESTKNYARAGDSFYHAAENLAGSDPWRAMKVAQRAGRDYQAAIGQLDEVDVESSRGLDRDLRTREELTQKRDGSYNLAKDLRHAAARRRMDAGAYHITELVLMGAGLIGLFFLSPSLTGKVVSMASVGFINPVGAVLVLVGLVGVFLYIKNRRN